MIILKKIDMDRIEIVNKYCGGGTLPKVITESPDYIRLLDSIFNYVEFATIRNQAGLNSIIKEIEAFAIIHQGVEKVIKRGLCSRMVLFLTKVMIQN